MPGVFQNLLVKFLKQISFPLIFFTTFTLCLYHDVVASLSTKIIGGAQCGGVASFFVWWWKYALTHHLPIFFTNFLMYPAGTPLFIQSPVNESIAVLLQTFVSPYAAINILFLASYILTGLSSYWLIHKITKNSMASLLGSFLYAFSHFMLVQHLNGQVNEAVLFFNPIFAWCFLNFLEAPHLKNGFFLFFSALALTASGPYIAYCFGFIFCAGTFSFYLLLGKRIIFRRETTLPLLAMGAGVGLIGLGFYYSILKHHHEWMGGATSYSVGLLSLFDLPFWHRSEWVQNLRLFEDIRFYSEQSMAYLGLATFAFLAYGVKTKSVRTTPAFKFWGWILVFSLVLSLGPQLEISPTQKTSLPLPYALFSHLPVLSTFRTLSRIIQTTLLATSVLVALGFAHYTARWDFWKQTVLVGLMMVFTFFEFDMRSVAERIVELRPSPVYEQIKNDEDTFAILELPSFYDQTGTMFMVHQYYMLFIPFHKKPIVLGYPGRYVPSSLEFTEKTPVIYELTHPHALLALKSKTGDAKKILTDHRIKYVVFHQAVPGLSTDLKNQMKNLLDEMFGKPVLEDDKKALLYPVYR